jgi:multimeric flavodoxin WrbA
VNENPTHSARVSAGAAKRPRVLSINAGLNGVAGNTAVLLQRARASLGERVVWRELTLADGVSYVAARDEITSADAVIFGTGTHWDSWSHLLQRFLEQATADEGSSIWLGKPVAVIVTMHSVGGKSVLSRLQGVLNTFGCLIPPMSGLVYSAVNQATLHSGTAATADVWSPEDVDVVCHNLLVALRVEATYRAWPTDREDFAARWIR